MCTFALHNVNREICFIVQPTGLAVPTCSYRQHKQWPTRSLFKVSNRQFEMSVSVLGDFFLFFHWLLANRPSEKSIKLVRTSNRMWRHMGSTVKAPGGATECHEELRRTMTQGKGFPLSTFNADRKISSNFSVTDAWEKNYQCTTNVRHHPMIWQHLQYLYHYPRL